MYPQMLYKDGKRGAHMVCKNTQEMVVAANEGFFPIGIDKIDDVYALSYVKADLEADKKKKEETARVNKLLNVSPTGNQATGMETAKDDVVIENPSLVNQYKKETGQPAVHENGKWVGRETNDFKAWKDKK